MKRVSYCDSILWVNKDCNASNNNGFHRTFLPLSATRDWTVQRVLTVGSIDVGMANDRKQQSLLCVYHVAPRVVMLDPGSGRGKSLSIHFYLSSFSSSSMAILAM